MSTNIIEQIQINLEYPPLHKIDPNIQETKPEFEHTGAEKLAQAAIPAVVAALYKYSKTDDGAARLLKTTSSEDWLSILYNGKEREAVEKIARYASVSKGEAEIHMEDIADESIRLVKEAAGAKPTPEKIKSYMNDQRHNVLVYLPAALAIGDLLNDEAMDDRTNKMEGPISNFMHKIEDKFSGGN